MSISEFLLYFVLPAFVAGYFFLKKKFAYFEENGIPHIKPNHWLLGNVSQVGTKYHFADFMRQLYDECKGKDVIAGFYGMTAPTYIVTDLELVKNITIKDFSNFTDRGMYVNEENEPITGNLFSIPGEKWKYLRNKLSPVFTSGKIKLMYSTISTKGGTFVQAIKKESEHGSVNMKNVSNRFTIDVVSSSAFGMETNTLNGEHPEFVEMFAKVFGADGLNHFKNMLLMGFPNFSKFLNLRMFEKSVEDFFFDVVGGTINYRESNNVTRNDFLNMLIQLKNKGSIDGEISTETRKLTLNECVAQAFIFFFAGADTSSTTIAYAITELSIQPEIQERLRQEIIEKTKATNGEITYDNLHEMTYLNQVVNETLRKYSPGFITMREAAEDYKIPESKHILKKGTRIMIPNLSIHYDDRYWKNPDKFDPDRFTPEEVARRPNLAYMPFGEGPRNCIGMRFAQVNVKFAVATVIKHFKATLDSSKTKLPLKFVPNNPSLEPIGGFWIKFTEC